MLYTPENGGKENNGNPKERGDNSGKENNGNSKERGDSKKAPDLHTSIQLMHHFQ